MEGAFYYTYITTNLSRKEKGLVPYLYIGQHCTKNLDDGYYGSSKGLTGHIARGDKIKIKILRFFTNIYDLGDAEFITIRMCNAVKSQDYYNKDNRLYYNKTFEYGQPESVKIKLRNRVCSPETIENYRQCNIGNRNSVGYQHTEKTKKMFSENAKRIHKCEYCGKEVNEINYYRWHGEKCKLKPI